MTGGGELDGIYDREDGKCGGGKSGHHFGYSQNRGNGELYYRWDNTAMTVILKYCQVQMAGLWRIRQKIMVVGSKQ